MNEELNAALVAFIEGVSSAAQKAGEFGAEQLPDVIEQLLAWKFIESLLWCIPAMLVLSAVFFLHYSAWRKGGFGRTREGGVDEDFVPPIIFMTAIGLVCFFLFMSLTWLKILIAPKVYLIEYAAGLIK